MIMRRTVPRCVMTIATIALISALVAGCGDEGSSTQTSPQSGQKTITDLAGRTVEVPTPASAIVAIGPGALRLVCYVDAASAVVGIENVETQWGQTGRPYALAHPELLDLPIIGQGGPDSNPDPEMLLQVSPDVIFVAYLADAAKAAELQSKTGIPGVVVSYGELGTFDEALLGSLRLVGEITGNQARAEEVVAFIESCEDDLAGRTSDIPEADKPSVYVGGLGMKGTHGIESSSGDYPPLAAFGANNVVDETGSTGSVSGSAVRKSRKTQTLVLSARSTQRRVRAHSGHEPSYQIVRVVERDTVSSRPMKPPVRARHFLRNF